MKCQAFSQKKYKKKKKKCSCEQHFNRCPAEPWYALPLQTV